MNNSPEYIHSELPAIELFQKMGYTYVCSSDLVREGIYEILLIDRLKKALKRINPWIGSNTIEKAVNEISNIQADSLIQANEKVWNLIRKRQYAPKQTIDGKEEFKPIAYIDYENLNNNEFLVVNQLKFFGKNQHSIPDITIFINGIPIGVIECKAPHLSNAINKAIDDLNYYQDNSPQLFHYNQLNVALCKRDAKYGAIQASSTQYFYYRNKNVEQIKRITQREPTPQDVVIYNLFQKDKLLNIIRNYVIFETEEGITIKKLPRYQQIRATEKAIIKLQTKDKGGVIWHTQGSGKSLTMAYIARKLMAEENGFNNPTILILTDRIDLDVQITTTLQNSRFKNIHQASSVVHLEKLMRNDYGGIITSTIHKFQEKDKTQEITLDETCNEENEEVKVERTVKNGILVKTTKALDETGTWKIINVEEIPIEHLSEKENLFVMVDEAHRSQFGFVAAFMRTALPNAKFLAFTGTPISKEDKSTLGEFYGGDYIDVYTIKESVEDKATVELLYDQGIALLEVKKKELDKEFDETYKRESQEKIEKLKQHALKKYQLSKERITEIAKHIVNHYENKIFPDGHKAILVTDGREAAIIYKKVLDELKQQGIHNFNSKVVISIGSAKSDTIAKEYYNTLNYNKNNPNQQKPIYITPPEQVKETSIAFKLPFGDETVKDKSGKIMYNNTAILIVSDMLLTGYDCPIASCLYLDKPIREHNLLQAIARVNRSRKGKKAGFVMDYYGISDYLLEALHIFSGDLNRDDIIKDLSSEFSRLELNHAKLVSFFKPLKNDKNYKQTEFLDEAVLFLEPINKRDEFIEFLRAFNKSINIILPNSFAQKFQSDFKLFNRLKGEINNAYGSEEIVIEEEESKMLQDLIDKYLKSTGVQNLLEEPISIMDKDKLMKHLEEASGNTKELVIRNKLKYTIKVGKDKDPNFFKPLAERLEDLILQKKEGRISQVSMLEELFKIRDAIEGRGKQAKKLGFNSDTELVVFNTIKTIFDSDAVKSTNAIFESIKDELNIINWERKLRVKKDMQNKVMHLLMVKLERSEASQKAKEIIELIAKN